MRSAGSPAHPNQSSVNQSDDPQTTAEYLWVTRACWKACYTQELLCPCWAEGNARERSERKAALRTGIAVSHLRQRKDAYGNFKGC